MAFPTTSVLDNFNRADGELGSNWSNPAYSTFGPLAIISNTAYSPSPYDDGYWNVATFGPDCEVYVTLTTIQGESEYVYIYARYVNPGTLCDGYKLGHKYVAAGNDSFKFYRSDNGADTQIGATIYSNIVQGDKLGLEIVGSTLTPYIYTSGAWSALETRTDTTYSAAGYIGICPTTSTPRLDDFGGGTIAAGTVYYSTPAGTLASVGALVRAGHKVVAGTLNSTGALVKAAGKAVAGTLSSAGAVVVRQAAKVLAGTLTSAGVVVKATGKVVAGALTGAGSLVRQAGKAAAGTLTSAGSLVRRAGKIVAGMLTSAGNPIRQTARSLAGVLNSTGVLTSVRTFLKVVAGTLTSAGTLSRQAGKAVIGTLTSAGNLVRQTSRRLAGILSSTGVLARRADKVAAGALTSAGALVRSTAHSLAGMLASSGALQAAIVGGRTFYQECAGALAAAGAMARKTARALAGMLDIGSAGSAVGKLIAMGLTSLAFARLAKATASTKRPPALSGGVRGAPETHITSLRCLPLDPVDAELRQRLGIDTPHELLQTCIQGGLDIMAGDMLVVGSVEYPVRAVEEWPWQRGAPLTLRLILEELKR